MSFRLEGRGIRAQPGHHGGRTGVVDAEHLHYWEIRLHDNIAHSREKPVDLLFEGDSITDYWRDRGNPIWMQRYDRLNAYDIGVAGDKRKTCFGVCSMVRWLAYTPS